VTKGPKHESGGILGRGFNATTSRGIGYGMSEINEVLKWAVDSGRIRVDEYGRVYGIRKELKIQYRTRDNYTIGTVGVQYNSKMHKITVSRIVAYCKYGDSMFSKDIEVRHLNGNSKDNSFANIVLGTHYQNMMDVPKDIRYKRAKIAYSSCRKFSEDRKTEIRIFYASCKSYKSTMVKFDIVSTGTLQFILNKKQYSYENGTYRIK
jgi:hypothetical protein